MDAFLTHIFSVIAQIPRGKVSTYGDIARMSGFPGYARHVGSALSRLPSDSRLPWHRVVNAKGQLSLQGTDWQHQKARLEAEGVVFSDAGKIALKHYRWVP